MHKSCFGLDHIVHLMLCHLSKCEEVSIQEYVKRGMSAEDSSIGKSWINLCRGLSIAGDFTPELIAITASNIVDKLTYCCLCGGTGKFPVDERCPCQG